MAFKGRYTQDVAKRLKWEGGQYLPGRAPTGTNLYPQEYSQRLMLSSNNSDRIKNGRFTGGKADVGGDFWVIRHFYDDWNNLPNRNGVISFTPNTFPTSIATPHYETPQYAVLASFNDTDFPIVTPSDRSILDRIGTDAIAKLAPTKPEADLGSFLGELREGLPHAIGIRDTSKQRIARARNAGDEYLNVEFGWKPLLRDLRKFYDTYRRSEEILEKYHNASETLLRREHREDTILDVKVEQGSPKVPVPILSTANYGASASAGSYTKTTTTRIERWVVASFVYYAPEPSSSLASRKSDINKLYGASFTPNMAWNMTPWTWAADWIGNGGSIAANLTYLNTDSLVMPYCYVMETKSVKVEHEVRGSDTMYRTYTGLRPYFYQSFETVSKYRIQGTPYGFGLSWSGFSQKQLAILAALGISKSK